MLGFSNINLRFYQEFYLNNKTILSQNVQVIYRKCHLKKV